MKQITINKKQYQVNIDEYTTIPHKEYFNLNILNQLGFHERQISLLCELAKLYHNPIQITMNHVSHGGFIPIHCSPSFQSIYINQDALHADNILYNISQHLTNKNIYYSNTTINKDDIYVIHENPKYQIIISLSSTPRLQYHTYTLTNLTTEWTPQPTLYLHVSNYMNPLFVKHFHTYLQPNHILDYDNLIHLCIMVKNGGAQFREVLQKNMSVIDRWTILDTGSTDETIETIKQTLVGVKQGTLYEEPFVNFKVSRNRCLDLAGKHCKFIMMLDDTYTISGNLRNFLNIVRGDQLATSYTLYIESGDTKYGSNRIIKSDSGLRYLYRIHEVISDKDNVNVVIPDWVSTIIDGRFDYMEERTKQRKELDLKLLYEELEEDKTNPRTYYYLAQTYRQLDQYDKAYEFFLKRAEFSNSGFIQERIDAIFEAARLAHFYLNRPWEEFMSLYEKAWKADESRPDAIYFMGIYHYLKGDMSKAYEFFKKGFAIGFPTHCQYSLKPTLSFHFLPKFLSKLCYQFNNSVLGETVSTFFLKHNTPDADSYNEIVSYYASFKKMNEYTGEKTLKPSPYSKPLFVFVADGGFNQWSGSNILTTGVGGSETYIIEMARYIQKQGTFQVIVFCRCAQPEIFEGVEYKSLADFPTFVNETYIEHCMISRYTEYLKLTYNGYTENVYIVLHDLTPTLNMIEMSPKLKKIFCLSEWHVSYFTERFPMCAHLTVPFYYGIDMLKFQSTEVVSKHPYQFIYSSFPNRGLLPLLQMWPHIYKMNPQASLHIYSDVHGKWVNEVAAEHMIELRRLLDSHMSMNMNIVYHGWVDKATLAKAWLTSDVWLYPCIFMETFCLTALEAALTKTLVITNDLAALQNTVSNRGIIISGDASTAEWQQKALEKIQQYFSEKNDASYRHINYEWAANLSWENRANQLLQQYILPNKFKYKNMYGWYHDLPIHSKEIFISILQQFNNEKKKKDTMNILEVGTYTGMSLLHMLQEIPHAIGYGIDSWSNYKEENEDGICYSLQNQEALQNELSFRENAAAAGFTDRMFPIKGHSHDVLLDMISKEKRFDFIYIDGSHSSIDTYTDCYLAWQLLEKGGIMGIDDYTYNIGDTSIPILHISGNNKLKDSPYDGINQFLKKYKENYRMLHMSYRVFIEKI